MTLFEEVNRLQARVREISGRVDKVASTVDLQHEQINGARGLSAAVNELAEEVRALRKAAYWVAGLIVTGAIGFAFSVMLLIPGGS